MNPHLCDEDGRTALHYALEKNHYSLSHRLLKMGSDPNKADKAGVIPVMCVKSGMCLSDMIIAGGDVSRCDYDGEE